MLNSRAPMAIVGDPQQGNQANPEVLSNPTGAPIGITPMRGGMARQPMMVPHWAFGSDPSFLGGTDVSGFLNAGDPPYMDEPRALRTGVQYPPLSPFATDSGLNAPTTRALNQKGVQYQYGVPGEDYLQMINRYTLPGIGRGGLRMGV